ncbi:MAG: RNA polymerase sigma factor [Oscillospiraceae bacterium]|nr:RNA polymerase sigma factor [Oscillospiraceae bacterium]
MDNGASSYRRFLSGDDSGMVELIRDYKDGLLLYLNSFTNNLSLAEDCVQDTFIKLAIKKPKFREKSTFKTWLYAIGRNVTLDTLRKLRHHASLDEISELADMQDLEQDYLIEEQKIAVHRAIRNLKQDYQQVIYLVYFENFTNDETAKVMHKTKKQIENLLYNARKALKSELEKEGVCYENL